MRSMSEIMFVAKDEDEKFICSMAMQHDDGVDPSANANPLLLQAQFPLPQMKPMHPSPSHPLISPGTQLLAGYIQKA